MSIIFNWTVEGIDCHSQLEGKYDVVHNVHWRCVGIDGSSNATMYGSCEIPNSSESFTQYQDLTQQDVLAWVWANDVNKQEIEDGIAFQINAQLNPSTTKPLPWSQ